MLQQSQRRLPYALDTISIEAAICGNHSKIFLHSLRDQEPVEGIAVMEWKASNAHYVTERNRKHGNSVCEELFLQKLRKRPIEPETAQTYLYRQLPTTRQTDITFRFGIDGVTRVF